MEAPGNLNLLRLGPVFDEGEAVKSEHMLPSSHHNESSTILASDGWKMNGNEHNKLQHGNNFPFVPCEEAFLAMPIDKLFFFMSLKARKGKFRASSKEK